MPLARETEALAIVIGMAQHQAHLIGEFAAVPVGITPHLGFFNHCQLTTNEAIEIVQKIHVNARKKCKRYDPHRSTIRVSSDSFEYDAVPYGDQNP